jgi:hypothetical protein
MVMRGLRVTKRHAAISLSPRQAEPMSNLLSPRCAHIVPTGGDACDFCNTSPAFKGYQCENFEFSGFPVFKNGSGMWTTCRRCSELVDAEKWSTLAERAVIKFVKRRAVPRHEVPALWAQFTEIVRLFVEHKRREA